MCAREDLNLHENLISLGPQPSASTNSATRAEFEVTWLGLEPRTLSLKGRCSTN